MRKTDRRSGVPANAFSICGVRFEDAVPYDYRNVLVFIAFLVVRRMNTFIRKGELMRLINIYATKDGLFADTHLAGGCGDVKAAQLVIRLGEGLENEYDYYLRFCTPEQAQRGGMSVTEKLNSAGGIILFVLPACLMRGGVLRMQLVAARGKDVLYTPILRGGLEVNCPMENCGSPPQETGEKLYVFRDMADYTANRRRMCGYPFGN